MDGRGDGWGGNNPGYPRKAMPPKMMTKGPPYMIPMMPQQGVFPKNNTTSSMMMHNGHRMAQMPPYPEGVGQMPKMMGPPGHGYIHPKLKMGPHNMTPQMKAGDHMQGHSPRTVTPNVPGGSPTGMNHQQMVQRPVPPTPGNVMRGTSSAVPQNGMAGGLSPRMMGHNLSPLAMGPKRASGSLMPVNLSPQSLMHRYPAGNMHKHGNMMVPPSRGSVSPHVTPQMMGPPKIPGGGPPGGLKMAPGPPGGMGYNRVLPPMPPHMGMQNRNIGMLMSKPKMPLGMGTTSMMKTVPPLPSFNPRHNQALDHKPSDPRTKASRPASRRPAEPQVEQAAPSSPSTPPPEQEQIDSSMVDGDADAEFIENLKESVMELIGEQLAKAEGVYSQTFTLADENATFKAIIEGFHPILNALWTATKKVHKYSLDESFLEFCAPDALAGQVLVARREMETLEEFYRGKHDIEKLLSLYRTPNKAVTRDPLGNNMPMDREMSASMRAQEYAEVGYNQRNLVQKITAVDYRNALESEECHAMLPESFRLQQIKMASTLHFDVRTPPQCISPPSEPMDKDCAESALSKCATSMESSSFSSVAAKLMDKSSDSFFENLSDIPMLQLDIRYANGPQMVSNSDMMSQFSGGKAGFPGMKMPFPKGVNLPQMVPMPKMLSMRPPGPQGPTKPSAKQGPANFKGSTGPLTHSGGVIPPGSPTLPLPVGVTNPSQKLETPGTLSGPQPSQMKQAPPMFGTRYQQ
ncbi:heat shock protein 70, putative [Babesia ovis]|uniref:Heat shock protein 70, putative n=1 Tax=Babesia ovis TaxID=5869 RepID=A0A9W5TEE2_BABOV|nr:heat shock protein 70, putative [Babesia ovis]